MAFPGVPLQRAGIRACFATSEQDDHASVAEIEHAKPRGPGWRSARFCTYPQVLVLQVLPPIRTTEALQTYKRQRPTLHCLQILVHEKFVPREVEIFVGNDESGLGDHTSCAFTYIGKVQFQSNKKTDYVARQLLSLDELRHECDFLLLRVKEPHVGPGNLFSQIGIIAVNAICGRIGDGSDNFDKIGSTRYQANQLETFSPRFAQELNQTISAATLTPRGDNAPREHRRGSMADISMDLSLDPWTLDLIRFVNQAKHHRAAIEDFDGAHQLKLLEETVRAAGMDMSRTYNRRIVALQSENYSDADSLGLVIKTKQRKILHMATEVPAFCECFTHIPEVWQLCGFPSLEAFLADWDHRQELKAQKIVVKKNDGIGDAAHEGAASQLQRSDNYAGESTTASKSEK